MMCNRNAALLTLCCLLMGSKIAISVPHSDSIDLSSGTDTCNAGENCTVDSNGDYSQDSTLPRAELAGAVQGEQDARLGDCSEYLSGDCAHVHADEYSRHPEMAIFEDTAESVDAGLPFEYPGDSPTEASGIFSVNSSHSTRYYTISGDTSNEIWDELRGDANPLQVLPGVGRKPFGEASFSYSYTFQPDYDSDMSHCHVQFGKIDVQFETVLPQLEELEHKPDRLRRQWDNFQSTVIDHEAGHHKIYSRIVSELPGALDNIGKTPCDQLDKKVATVIEGVVASIQLASSHYDASAGSAKYMVSAL